MPNFNFTDTTSGALSSAVSMHDQLSTNATATVGDVDRIASQYPELHDIKTLRDKIGSHDPQSLPLCAFIIDNISDSAARKYRDAENIRKILNDIAQELQYDNFFDLYCHCRGASPLEILETSTAILEEDAPDYQAVYNHFPNGIIRKDAFKKWYSDSIGKTRRNYSFDLLSHCAKCDFANHPFVLSGTIDFSFTNDVERTMFYSAISPPKAFVLSPNLGSIEQFKAFYHAMGHAFYFADNTESQHLLLDSDVSRTEHCAFRFQKIPYTGAWLRKHGIHVSDETLEFCKFADSYFKKLYALKCVAEKEWYSGKSYDSVINKYAYLQKTFLKIEDDSAISPIDIKPISVDFTIGLSESDSMANSRVAELLKGLIGE